MSFKDAIIIIVVIVCETLLIRFGIRAGTGALESNFMIQGLIGAVPLLVLSKKMKLAYSLFAAIMIGTTGILLLSASFIQCDDADVFCALLSETPQLLASYTYYFVMLMAGMIGLVMMKMMAKTDTSGS